MTTQLRPGYLRKNGVPYSENAVLTEYYDLESGPGGATWITVTAIVNDPKYLTQEFITSTDFRKEPDGAKWKPAPCAASVHDVWTGPTLTRRPAPRTAPACS